jgi:hypothetical protein
VPAQRTTVHGHPASIAARSIGLREVVGAIVAQHHAVATAERTSWRIEEVERETGDELEQERHHASISLAVS